MIPQFLDSSTIWAFISPFFLLLYLIPPIVLAYLLNSAVLFYKQLQFKNALNFEMFEIRIPRLIEKGPKAMQQFFNAVASLRNEPGDWHDNYIDGEVTRWFSVELASFSGQTRFFMRVPGKLRSTIEAMLYGQYPDIEILDIDPADDYVNSLPDSYEGVKQIGQELLGMEIYLSKDGGYPLNTYESYESKEGDERIIDPMATMLELFSKLRANETIWLQFILKPANDDWKARGKNIIKDIKAKEMKERQPGVMVTRTPGEELLMKAIEHKIAQPGFDTIIRYMYFAPTEIFNKDLVYRGLTAYFNQFSLYNKFSKNSDTITRVAHWIYPYLFAKKRAAVRSDMMLKVFRQRSHKEGNLIGRILKSSFWFPVAFSHKSSILSSDELATMVHLPTDVVLTAPSMSLTDSKRVSAPSNLPG